MALIFRRIGNRQSDQDVYLVWLGISGAYRHFLFTNENEKTEKVKMLTAETDVNFRTIPSKNNFEFDLITEGINQTERDYITSLQKANFIKRVRLDGTVVSVQMVKFKDVQLSRNKEFTVSLTIREQEPQTMTI